MKKDVKSEDFIYPVIGASGIIGFSSKYNQEEKLLTIGRVGTLGVVNRYKEKLYTADNVLIIKSQYYEYSYHILLSLDYASIQKGGVQSLIIQSDLLSYLVVIPNKYTLEYFEINSTKIFKLIDVLKVENEKLKEMQSLLLANM